MDKVATSLSLMRRLPPNKIDQNLSGLLNLIPEETDELLQRIDQPLTEEIDKQTGRKFLICDYNRDGDSHRSPWSNQYQPHLEDGFLPSEKLRLMEIEANELFDAYRELYFEGGTSSVYFWDLDRGFAGCFLIKKSVEGNQFIKEGCWDSIHIIEALEGEISSKATYKLTTTVMLHMGVEKSEVGNTSLSGSLTRQTELTCVVDVNKPHMANIGRMIEDMEFDMRSNLNELYVMKTREIVHSLHRVSDGPVQQSAFIASLNAAVISKGAKNITSLTGES
mmetsp:Transcript_1611/g.1751  ORF Transcript_1611/g.1751 Transcript_1611/m.1751 type:complete len:279 (-) Transcript_1611:191-1027(-)|eukprot:CAMPEP_0119035604 /NCGR_PEP_ID=MMETSP1177-20130426/2740_1 /TAXON_ID=2985 /ORGANISM="Ochromonas sp, Strain CCMP1899" /LENGTH=278 /DNA_ID=CAMNT_0006994119 /DNA_START=113 /DNA_END=949 /DNA_ORIENTATION=-